ncbi:MAG: tRNA epoxyqueuosine(34) reductase QueG [Anaerolineales bacterium]|nr:tRNA epoxyqueuosine(34) reductase QueG [Anaerolineales bacterium]
MNQTLLPQLRTQAANLGFATMGVIAAAPAKRLDAYLQWVAAEMHGSMGYLARPDRLLRRQDPSVILPGVRSIVSVGLPYFSLRVPEAVAQDPARGRISNYAWGVDYHDVLTPRLQALADWLTQQVGGAAQHRVYVDTGAILERDHGETAVLGFTGKNSMLIQPRRGSWFFLGEILTTVDLTGAPLAAANWHTPSSTAMPGCGACHRCLDACPTQAFPQPYVLDARRCISYLTIELKGWIPQALRPLMGNWIYGCDVCQEVCPFNRFAQPTTENAFYPTGLDVAGEVPTAASPVWDAVAPPLLAILRLDEAGFAARFAHSPVKRIRRTRLLRNACVAAGNWGSETAVPALIALLTDPEPLIRGHAAWALRQIGGLDAVTAVAAALVHETETAVRAEMTCT